MPSNRVYYSRNLLSIINSAKGVNITDSHNLYHQATYIITSYGFETKPLHWDLVGSCFLIDQIIFYFLGIKVDLIILKFMIKYLDGISYILSVPAEWQASTGPCVPVTGCSYSLL